VRLLSADARAAGALLHIATHDPALIARLRQHAVQQAGTSPHEFAMLYGIGVRQQQELVAAGEKVRVLISYGESWFPWYMRRLAERPANIWFVVKSALRR
jgi:proline dehydrogenase